MKKYGHVILWLDYFNSNLSRKAGRKVPASLSVSRPTLNELAEAARRIGLSPEATGAKHPKRYWEDSGYIVVKKTMPKVTLIREIAKQLTMVRGQCIGQAKVDD